MKNYWWLVLCFVSLTVSSAADPEWTAVTTELLAREKTGFGGLCGVVVDHTSGNVWVNLSDRGMFHSADQGKTWQRVSETQPKGRTESPGCWLLDPTGKSKRMAVALVYGSPLSISSDQAATWTACDGKSGHIDWCAIDWTDPESKFILALKHEAGGLLLASHDSGKSSEGLGKGYATGWVFGPQTAVVAQAKTKDQPKPQLMRTTDGGKSFKPCGDYSPVGANSAQALPKWHAGSLYWLVEGGLIVTADHGETWKKTGEVKDAMYGPIFGKTAQQMFVLTKAGVVESTDGGSSWSSPLVPPKEMKGLGGLSWLEYDPLHDTVYLMKMGSELYRLSRGK